MPGLSSLGCKEQGDVEVVQAAPPAHAPRNQKGICRPEAPLRPLRLSHPTGRHFPARPPSLAVSWRHLAGPAALAGPDRERDGRAPGVPDRPGDIGGARPDPRGRRV